MDRHDTRELKCVLTEGETLTYSRELAKKNQDRTDAEQAKKAVMADYKDKIETLTTDINQLARKISNGYEHKPVDCTWHFDWESGKKTLYRNDTGERVDVADITPYERQQGLELGETVGEPGEDPTMPEPTKPARRKKADATA